MGGRTPVGMTMPASAAAVRAGISRLSEHPFLADEAGEPLRVAHDAHLELQNVGLPRMLALACSALREAATTAGNVKGLEVDLLLATPELRPGWTIQDEQMLLRTLATTTFDPLTVRDVKLVGRGHAGGLQGIERALDDARTDVGLLVCGVDSYLDPRTLDWLLQTRQLASRANRSGFHAGEGAGALLLAPAGFAAPNCASLLSCVSKVEMTAADPEATNLAHAYWQAMREAAGRANVDEPIDTLLCDLNGERPRSEEWGFLALQAYAVLRDASAYRSACGAWGDVGAASGPLLTALACRGWSRGEFRGTRAMVTCASRSGVRGVAVIERGRM